MPIPEVDKIWMDGELVDWKEAKVHILTHSLHYGSGVFEGIRAYETPKGAAVFRLTDHMKRLFRSAHIYHMEIPFSLDELVEATKVVIRANGLKSCYIRPIAFRGYGEMGLHPLGAPVNVAIAVWPWGAYLGEEGIEHGVRAKVSSFRRNEANSIPTAAKATGQYLNSILAKMEVIEAGYDEAVLLNMHGHIADGAGENIFVARHGSLYTPPTSSGALEGITRDSVMIIAEDFEIPCRERDLVRTDLYIADEAFFTGTAAEVVPIREIDNRAIGEPGPITKRIQGKFFQIVAGKDKDYDHWLEYVD
ncbi:MAG: branched chain amino acid aminotransferase [Candidatus Solincola sediminis]|uniref:Branched-chain-amino-acid aminotransferase n=1 Tax=Candidatus Solincola sediminis TaxID=1797199 RepID=A0A1F2WH54_9ACTN|nr:MAG: branched chain amino acid aminotransferase [Candidatus Solincola sediminis]OFW60414.1 MAG: branched chain amino acid aminotransferase [Candidatus Solincola sediminis]